MTEDLTQGATAQMLEPTPNAMTFGDAIASMKAGWKVARHGWNGPGQFVFLVPGSTFEVNRAPPLGIFEEGHKISYQPHIDIHRVDGSIATWSPSNGDALAEDWYIVEDI